MRFFKLAWRKVTTDQLLLISSILIFVAAAFRFTIVALDNALHFDGVPVDGSFQLLNPLRRIAEGQAVGRDFNFFHGAGVPYIHYPFFWLFGSDVFASELVKWLLSPVIFTLSAFLFLYAFSRKWRFSLVGTAIVLVVAMRYYSLFVFPSNSLLDIRSFATVLVACVLLFRQRLQKPVLKNNWLRRVTWFEVLAGLSLAIALVMGTEYGIASASAFTLYALINHHQTLKERLISIGITAALSFIWLFLILALLSKGHPVEPLLYAFKDVPGDQFWYFGTPPNKYLYSIGYIISTIKGDSLVHLPYFIFLLSVGLVYLYKRAFGRTEAYYTFVFMLLTGFISQVSMFGYYQSAQTYNLARLSSLILVASGATLLATVEVFKASLKPSKRKSLVFTTNYAGIARFLAILFLLISVWQGWQYLRDTRSSQDIKGTLISLKYKVKGGEQQMTPFWSQTLSNLMPVIQKNNAYAIADYNQDGFVHGINAGSSSVVIKEPHTVLKRNSAVYFAHASRQIVLAASSKSGLTFVQLRREGVPLGAADSYPQKLIVGHNFVAKPSTLWSTYTGLIDYEKGSLNASSTGADFVIHALGNEKRARYVADFSHSKPDYVLTFQKPYFGFEEWLQDENWSFYNKLIANYHVVKSTQAYVLWGRNQGPWQQNVKTSSWSNLSVDGKDIVIPSIENNGPSKMGLIKVKYNFGSGLKPYDKTTRWFLKPFGDTLQTELPESLSPYQNEAIFPFVYQPTPNGPPKEGNNIVEIETYNLFPLKTPAKFTEIKYAWIEGLDPTTQDILTR